MKNLMTEAIDRMYNDGSLDITYGNVRICLRINEDNKLIALYNPNLDIDGFEDDYELVEDETTIVSYLASLFMYTIFKSNKNIELDSQKQIVKENAKLEAINKIYNVWYSMLQPSGDKIRQMITGNSIYQIIVNNFFRTRKDEVNTNGFNIQYIKDSLDVSKNEFLRTYSEALEIWNELQNSKSEEEYSENTDRWFKVISKNEDKAMFKNEDTSMLDRLGITYEIINDRDFIINPALGRQSEIREVGSTLLTPSYSSLLLGHPGVGKSAVIEGLAYAIKHRLISEKLFCKKILKINPSSIISGCTLHGMLEQKMEAIINFLKNNPDVILYMDELHTAMDRYSKNDILNMLKPHIENGSIRMICATTIEEYDEYLKDDMAFTRRFKTVTVNEPDAKLLKEIIIKSIEKYEKITNVEFESDSNKKDAIIDILIDATDESHRVYYEKRYNPDLVLSIIQSAFGYASYDKKSEVGTSYLIEAINKCENICTPTKEEKALELSALDSKLYYDEFDLEEKKSKLIAFPGSKK